MGKKNNVKILQTVYLAKEWEFKEGWDKLLEQNLIQKIRQLK